MKLIDDIFAEFKTPSFDLQVPSSEVSFSLIDSIHSIFSRATMAVNDRNGLYSEYLLSTPGNILTMKYGSYSKEEDVLENNLVLNQEMMETSSEAPNRLSGMIELSFLHEWYNYQKIDSVSYQDSISNIVNTLTNNYSFSKKIIKNTSNYDTFFQGLRTESQMIKQDFLPVAYSTEANKTPFFAFINSRNEFNFSSYDAMFNGDTVDDEYVLQRSDLAGNTKIILDVARWSEPLTESNKYNISNYILDSNSVISSEYLDTQDYFPKPKSKLATYPLANNLKNPRAYRFNYYGDASKYEALGEINNSMRSSLFKDRLMILVPFNPRLLSGKKVYLDFFIPNAENDTYSERFTGKYLIEMSEHTWDGKSGTALSKFLVSRKYADIPDAYQLKGLMK